MKRAVSTRKVRLMVEDPGRSMFDDILGLADQLRWAADLDLPEERATGGDVVLAGMGGSGLAASVAVLASRTPLVVHPGYGLPLWATGPIQLVAVSYSGNTEETLSAVEGALAGGGRLAAVTTGGALEQKASEHGAPAVRIPGGLQPRAALGYQAGATLRLLNAMGFCPDLRPDLRATADLLDELLRDGSGPAVALGRELGAALAERATIVYGGLGPASLAARRWKTSINENAKMPAWFGILPELNHNELEGWSTLAGLTREAFGVVVLTDPLSDERTQLRVELTQEFIAGNVMLARTVAARGSSELARFFSLAVVGDLASVEMARLNGVDPTPVLLLEDFKRRLREEET